MEFTYNTISEANTFIRTYNAVIAPQQGNIARLVSEQPGLYTVLVA